MDNNLINLYIMVGLQGSGKSSYVEQTMLGATSFGVEDVIVVDSGSKSDNIGGKKIQL